MENSLIAIGKINEINEKYIRIYNKNKELKVVDYGKLVKVNIFNAQNGFRVIVGNVYTSTRGEMSLVSVVSLVNKERRNFFRVDMNIEARVIFKSREFTSKELDVTVLDMSLSGLRFKTEHEFNTGSLVSVELNLDKKGKQTYPCKIIRIIGEESDNEHQYGCEFSGSRNDSMDALCSFLFQKQREFLNSRKKI
jgi:hypothetical protein